MQLEIPFKHFDYSVGSCKGTVCFLANYAGFVTVRLWNPSIRKFKEFPSLENQLGVRMSGFGYDAVTNNYKVVVVLPAHGSSGNFVNEMKVLTLGTDSWKSIQEFPYVCVALQLLAKFVSGTINCLVSKKYDNKIQCFIVSLNLGNESCKEISLPDDYGMGNVYINLYLGVLRDCLCLACGHDVWVMKEYGNKDSWTKLFTISYMPDFPTSHATIEVVHMFEDGLVLLKSKEGRKWKLIFYNSRNGTCKFTQNGTFTFTQLENICEVCVESLISPCS